MDITATYVLTGAPNSGKSSLFNRLTGLRQKVGNYPGVTVDKISGSIHSDKSKVELIDLPGCYSLYPTSADERVVLDILTREDSTRPDGVVHVLSAHNLQRGLLLLSQIIDLGYPCMVVLSMDDLALESGISIDIHQLEERLGLHVITANGRTGEGLAQLKGAILKNVFKSGKPIVKQVTEAKNSELISEMLGVRHPYAAQLLAPQASRMDRFRALELGASLAELDHNDIRYEVEDKQRRIAAIDKGFSELVLSSQGMDSTGTSSRFDAILTHRVWGSFIFLLVLFILFQSVFSWAVPLMDWIDEGMLRLTSAVRDALPESWWSDLICDGILAGLGGVVIFIPQIAILFGLIAILEQSGYMTRAVYLSDKLMSKSGLNGRSLVSLISGVACAVPAIMAARTIGNQKERLITIFVTPFMSCSARLPVYVVLIALIVPQESVWGGFSLQGLIMFGLYFLGTFAALATAYVLKRFFKTGESSYLMMEMPRYQWPRWRDVLLTMYEKSKVFVWQAGKIILIISIILWALASYGPGTAMQDAEVMAQEQIDQGLVPGVDEEAYIASLRLESSYMGMMGKAIEPAIEPLGFDWKIGIALISSFAAREVFVGSMATIYSATDPEDELTVIQRLQQQKDIITGERIFTPVRALSLLLFYVFAMQCMSTLAIVKRETRSWKIPLAQFAFMTAVAYLSSLFVWQVFS